MDANGSARIGLFSWIPALFMNGIIATANRGDEPKEEIKDVDMDAEAAFQRFDKEWKAEVAAAAAAAAPTTSSASAGPQATAPDWKARQPSLVRALWRAFRRDVLMAAGLKLVWGTLMLLSVSFFVRELLAYIREAYFDTDHTNAERAKGYILCAFFFLCTLMLSVALQQMNAVSARLGLRLKSAMATAVYRKVLVVDRHHPASKVDVVSLVATDCSKLGDACTTLQFLWSGLAEAIAILGVLLGFVGRAALPGLGILLLLVPVQYVLGMAAARFRKKTAAAADARVALMDEILRAIKLVKMYAWEDKFAASVAVLRGKETALARVGGYLKSMNLALVFVLPPLIALGIFGVHALESPLDSALAFTTLSIFNTLRLPLVQLPKSLRALAEATSAAERVGAYLCAPDREVRPFNAKPGVTFDKASFTYVSTTPALLTDISMSLAKGTLTMIAGPVGSGKSNLLAAIMGQMKLVSGTAIVGGSFAYVPQTPWCAHGTVRDNILFGRPWDEARYRRVLFSCALERDLQLMDEGDLTEIGERGMNLSGGQKQRIALARAAYSGADVLLLDAPLSAVDMYTCQHIFKYCLTGMLAAEGSTVILVTHQVELFDKANTLIVMARGKAAYVGAPTASVIRQYFPNANATPELDAQLLEAVVGSTTASGTGTGAAQGFMGSPRLTAQADHGVLSPVPELPAVAEGEPSNRSRDEDEDEEGGRSPRSGPGSPQLGNQAGGHNSSEFPSRQTSGKSTGFRAARQMSSRDVGFASPGQSALRGHSSSHDHDGGAGVGMSSMRSRSNTAADVAIGALTSSVDMASRAMSLRADLLKTALEEVAAGHGHGLGHSHSGQPSPVRSQSFSTRKGRAVSMRHLTAQAAGGPGSPASDLQLILPGSSEMAARDARKKQLAADKAAIVKANAQAKGSGASSSYLSLLWELRWYFVLVCVGIAVVTQVTRIFSDIWISLWVGRRYGARAEEWYIGIYGGYVGTFLCLLLLRGLSFYAMGLAAASRMHGQMFTAILKAPMSFFTLTPLGKVLSVFSKDMDAIDEALLDNMHMVMIYLMILGTTIGVVIRVLPVFAAIAAGLLIAAIVVFRYYLRASQVLKEKAGTASAQVVAHVSETLQGMPVIQAYRAEERFASANLAKNTASQTSGFTLEMLQLWLTFRQDFIGCLLVLATCLLGVSFERLAPADAGLAVSNSFQILLFLSLMVRGAADVHAHMASVERVVALGQEPPEPDLPLSTDTRPKDGWPSRGEVDFHAVVMSYLPNTPHVLKGVNFNVLPGEKVGIVGRTGAGKSSLIMSLFRLAPLSEGAVRIDGVDVAKLRLQDLRKRISIIPQEPVMFQGTLRSNLDPFDEHSDVDVAAALDKCLLSDVLARHPDGLNQPVAWLGDNFSLGQQQLICLARALLNGSRLLLLDEATAALDTDTDAAVQRVLRTAFADRTVMTIAHRLDTIIDSDRIIVMDAGRVAEFASPADLLSDEGSIFSQLCRQTGAGSFASLKAAATRHASTMQALAEEVVFADEVRLAGAEAGLAPVPDDEEGSLSSSDAEAEDVEGGAGHVRNNRTPSTASAGRAPTAPAAVDSIQVSIR